MPFALKGIDVAIFSVFSDLGLEVLVRPMVMLENEEEDEEEDDEEDEMVLASTKIEGPRIGQFIGITGYNQVYESRKREVRPSHKILFSWSSMLTKKQRF